MDWTRGTTVSEFYENCYRRQKHAGRSAHTVSDYRTAIRRFRAHFEASGQRHDPMLSDLTDDNLCDFLAWYVDDLQCAPETPNKYARNLKAIWRHAIKKGVDLKLPDFDRLTTPKHARKTWTPWEFQWLLDAASKIDGVIGGVPAMVFWRALLMTVTNTASRINAVMQLQVDDLDFTRGTIALRHENVKDNADHRAPMLPATREALLELLKYRQVRRDERVFGCWPYDGNGGYWATLRDYYKVLLESAGLPTSRRFLFHCLRAYTLTRIASAHGIEAARQFAKHSQLSVTLAYIDFDQVESSIDIQQVFPEFSGSPPPPTVPPALSAPTAPQSPPGPPSSGTGPRLRVFRGEVA